MITRIEVKKLFGLYDYDIPLNVEEGITIIYGMNGSGKTTLLNMIKAAIDQEFDLLNNFKFEEFNIYFADMYLQFKKSKDSLSVRYKAINDTKPSSFNCTRKKHVYSEVIRYVDDNDIIDGRAIHSKDVQFITESRYEVHPGEYRIYSMDEEERKDKKIKERLRLLIKERVSIHFIETQRLYDFNSSTLENNIRKERNHKVAAYVDKYSSDLAKRIQKSLTEYSEISQKLDKTFPQRLLRQEYSLSESELKVKLVALEDKRKKLGKAGILEENDNAEFIIPDNISDQELKVLTVYTDDVQNKLAVFDILQSKIENLIKLLKFSNKEVNIDKNKGFIFKNDNGDEVLPTQLSSGEQHELVMMYQMIFMLNDNVLVLIDEPELSLHIIWQKAFIKNLKSIMESTKLNVLIATHSPQIINNYWSATVKLGGGK